MADDVFVLIAAEVKELLRSLKQPDKRLIVDRIFELVGIGGNPMPQPNPTNAEYWIEVEAYIILYRRATTIELDGIGKNFGYRLLSMKPITDAFNDGIN